MVKYTDEQLKEIFGFNPNYVGNRPRRYFILEELDEDDEYLGAKIGDLCIETRDGASNPIDMDANTYGIFIGTSQDSFDCTYRYYYYRKI